MDYVLAAFFEDESRINFKMFARQIARANVIHSEDNRRKSNLIKVASVMLTFGIIITAMGGAVLLTFVILD